MKFRGIISIALIFLVIYQCMGYVWLHEMQIHNWKGSQLERLEADIHDGLRDEKLVTIAVSDPHSLDWENSHEFEYNGEMYDVVRSRQDVDGSWVYQCILDHHESLLKDVFSSIFADQENDARSTPVHRNIRLITSNYLETSAPQMFKIEQALGYPSAHDWQMHNLFLSKTLSRPPIFS